MATSSLEICNRALQKLGARRISSLSEDTKEAREIQAAYDPLRRALLRAHSWNFAIKRFTLAADTDQPAFGKKLSFPLPTGYLRLLPPDSLDNPYYRDWTVEGGKILSDYQAPLNIRCVMDIEDASLFDPLFAEALSCKLASELCETFTQSNTKKQTALALLDEAIKEARRGNSIEKPAGLFPVSSWVAVRRS